MGKRRFFDKESSFAEDEVVLSEVPEAEVVAWSDIQETETFTEREQEPKDEQVEAKVSTEITPADIKWAKANLKGHPNPFDSASAELLERLVRHGIAADFGNEGFGRGHKFPTV